MSTTIDFDPIDQGASWSKVFQLNDTTGHAINLTGCLAHIQFRDFYGNLYADLTVGNGIVIDGTQGLITLSMSPSQTSKLVMRQLYYDFDLTWPDGLMSILFNGHVDVNFAITLATSGLDFSNPDNSFYLGLLGQMGTTIPISSFSPSFNFSDSRNSFYLALV